MPIVVVNIKEGRTLEQKRDMVTKVTDALCETMEVPKTSVRIIINEELAGKELLEPLVLP